MNKSSFISKINCSIKWNDNNVALALLVAWFKTLSSILSLFKISPVKAINTLEILAHLK